MLHYIVFMLFSSLLDSFVCFYTVASLGEGKEEGADRPGDTIQGVTPEWN